MAKRLSTQTKANRLREAGYSRKELASAFGVSVSTMGRIERGQTSGASVEKAVSSFYRAGKTQRQHYASGAVELPGKREPVRRPPRRKAEVPSRIVTPLERAAGKLSQLDKDTKVVVKIQARDGSVRVLYSKGGIEAGDIGDLGRAIASQEGSQYRGDYVDWDDVVDISVDEY